MTSLYFFVVKQNEQLTRIDDKRPNYISPKNNVPQPENVFHRNELHNANLPVDYYENDDGFWDEIIEEKLARYEKAQRMNRVRKHLVHWWLVLDEAEEYLLKLKV